MVHKATEETNQTVNYELKQTYIISTFVTMLKSMRNMLTNTFK